MMPNEDDDDSSLSQFQKLLPTPTPSLPSTDLSALLDSSRGVDDIRNSSYSHPHSQNEPTAKDNGLANSKQRQKFENSTANCYSWLLHGRERKISEGALSSDTSTTSSSSASSSSSEASFPSLPMPTPPDGGWGWMVVLGAFLVLFICDGFAYCFGVIYYELLVQFGESRSKTSLVGSIFFGVSMILGPFASAMTTRFGCRKMTIVGGVLSSFGFLISYFATSIEMLFFTFSVIVGTGFSFCYVTSAVIVHFYFDKRRSLATGLAVCGTGVGTFTFAPLMEYLIGEYGWRGLFLIMAGISLNLIVSGMLFVSLKFTEEERWQHYFTEFDKLPHGRESLELGRMRNASECTEFSTELDVIDEESRTMSMLSLPTFIPREDPHNDPSSEILLREALKNSKNPHLTFQRYMKNTYLRTNNGGNDNSMDITTTEKIGEKTITISRDSDPFLSQSNTLSEDIFKGQKDSPDVNKMKNQLINNTHQKTILKDDHNLNIHSDTKLKQKSVSKIVSGMHMGRHNSMGMQLLLYRTDIFYRRQLNQAAQNNRPCLLGTSCPELVEPNTSPETLMHKGRFRQMLDRFLSESYEIILTMADFGLFHNVFFTLFVISNFLFYFWNDIPYMFAADHSIAHGISTEKASFLISILGITNAVGQLFFGLVGDLNMNLINIFALSLFLSGVLTALIPLMQAYWSMALVYALFGFFVSVNFPFVSVLLVNYLGVEQLTNAYGLLMLMQGVANILGPPFAGWISDDSGNYDYAFYLSGIFYALSGLIMYVVLIPRCRVEQVVNTTTTTIDSREIGSKSKDSLEENC